VGPLESRDRSLALEENRVRDIGLAIDWRAEWERCAPDYVSALLREPPREQEAREELLFCLLGGHGIAFELARSAWERLVEIDCLSNLWDRGDLEKTIAIQLNEPQFRPVRRDGSLRRYRYPTSKATQLVNALSWLDQYEQLVATLSEIPNERDRRILMCTCPGVGMKTASWYLRNVGLARELAVIDIHILRALDSQGRLPAGRLPSAYDRIERAFLDWCGEVGAPPGAFDLFLWDLQRRTRQRR
jgi:thermostable 8-oxoguanine DNA glycosylase